MYYRVSSDLIEIVTIVHQKRKNIKRILLNMKNAVIFGASSTIAVKLADILAQNGYNLVLLARNVEYLQLDAQNLRVKHQNVVINTLYYDASVDTNMPDLIEKIKQSINSIDLLVIAHGNLPHQELCQKTWQDDYNSILVNGVSVLQICHYFANLMQEQRYGTIATISSVAGIRGRQSNYNYGTAKAMINTYLSGLRNRLANSNVHVLTVLPGFVDTKMTALFKKGALWASPEKVARDIFNAINKKTNILYTPFFWRYIMLIIKCVPEQIFKKLKL